MRHRDELRAAADRPDLDSPAAGRASPRLGTLAQAAAKAGRIDLVAGERMAIASDDSSAAWQGLDKGLLLKVGLAIVGVLAIIGLLSLAQRLLGL